MFLNDYSYQTNNLYDSLLFSYQLQLSTYWKNFQASLIYIYNQGSPTCNACLQYLRQIQVISLFNQMKRKLKKNSQKSLEELSSQSQSESLPQFNKEYVEAQRKKTKPKPKSKENLIDENNEVLDIHHGDSFIRQHVRPSFMKRWDGQSNTLDLTQAELENLSPMLRVYWECKSKNMNCVIFCQIGKVEFFAFEDDAIKLHQIFKKKLKKFSSFLMVNFWSKQVQLAKAELFERRIPVLMLNQIEDDQYKKTYGIFKRQITEVITPSIYLTMQPKKFRERMMLAIFIQDSKCGVACVDVQTNHFYLEQYEEDQTSNIHEIRRLINKYRPAELLVQKKDNVAKRVAKQVCQPYVIELSPLPGTLISTIQKMRSTSQDELFQRIQKLYNKQKVEKQSQFSLYPIVKVLSLILHYMTNLALQAKIFGQGIFEISDFDSRRLKPMFDAQVYQNLQVFSLKDQEDSFGKPGTLINYLNGCVTQSGLKLLKKWIDEPLRTATQISKRQIAVQNLLQDGGKILQLHKQLLGFEKLERRIGNIYHWALRQSQQGKLILTKQMKFDKEYDQKKNPAVIRIKEIFDVLKLLTNVEGYFKKISKFDLGSQLLKKNCKIIDGGDLYRISKKQLQKLQGLPSIEDLISKLLRNIHIEPETGLIQPAQGINQVFDSQKQEISRINSQLEEILAKWKKKLGVSRAYYVSIRARNQIEVPLSEVKDKKFPQLIFSSQTSKMIRYVTPQVADLTQQLILHQQAIALAYQPFCLMMVKQFCAHKHIWDLYINSIAKIDVLMSLAKVSDKMQPKCLPVFVDDSLYIDHGYHPGLLQVKPKSQIVGNTLNMQKNKKILLLTGPNMGGKSTLLRQTCLLAILAQIGCYVPCEKYQCIIFDQLFCRIGASDRIIEGKSTFYVQLEETKRIIDQATPNSLVIIDQLGRGTSTYDGMALASAILKYIVDQIQCYTLFSTHYFSLTEEFMSNPSIMCGKIGYQFDKQKQRIQFTYQLEPGIAEKSFANQVAQQVGISSKALLLADKKAGQIQISSKFKKIKLGHDQRRFKEVQQFLEDSD